jgi:glycosyltransferase involved in cell wall biosynthesis
MRLLLVTNRYPVSADDTASPFVPHFVAALQQIGVSVDVLTPCYADAPEQAGVYRFFTGADQPIGSWNLKSPATWWRIAAFLRRGRALGRELCAKNNYDHILALWALPSGQFARQLYRQFGIPYSVWCLGSDINAWGRKAGARGQIKRILRGATAVFADGEELCERVESGFGAPCSFLPSFRPLPVKRGSTPPQPTVRPRYLYLGRMHRDKGVFELIEAFVRVRARLPAATLKLIGTGPDSDELRHAAGIQVAVHSVEFCGAVDRAGLVAALKDCDFVVIPTKSDSLPLVFSEAVQMSRPVIGTDVGDLGRMITRYHVGLITRSLHPGDLAMAMCNMASDAVFDRQGRRDLLKILDPSAAAKTFATRALGIDTAQSRPDAVKLPTFPKGKIPHTSEL